MSDNDNDNTNASENSWETLANSLHKAKTLFETLIQKLYYYGGMVEMAPVASSGKCFK